MASAKVSVEFEAPIETAFEVISDFESYPDFLAETKEVIIEERNENSARVTFKISMIKKIKYTLDLNFEAPNKVRWELVKGDLMKKNTGSWTLKKVNKGKTSADYEIDIDLGRFVPKTISDKLVGVNLPSMLKAFKNRIEEVAS